jgi:RNA polymerase sigma-70 factor, ECF subfamily
MLGELIPGLPILYGFLSHALMPPADAQLFHDDSHAAARDLMARIQQGDRDAFAALYDLCGDVVYSVALKLLADETAAQDVMQEVFCKIWSASHLYDPGLGKVVAWIITITRHLCLNRIRSDQRRANAYRNSAAQPDTQPEEPGAAQLLVRQETAAAVHASLQTLPPDQSEAIRLAFFQNMTHESAAAALNVPLGTLKARIRRGLLRLQEQLQFIR